MNVVAVVAGVRPLGDKFLRPSVEEIQKTRDVADELVVGNLWSVKLHHVAKPFLAIANHGPLVFGLTKRSDPLGFGQLVVHLSVHGSSSLLKCTITCSCIIRVSRVPRKHRQI